jgi:3-dehydroquinate dehydratase/shikimate dehydrogenase
MYMKSIVVSVCAKTVKELVEQIKKAEKFGDVIEVRFDCLDEEGVEKILTKFPAVTRPILATFRPQEHGGSREISLEEREGFWRNFPMFSWADMEPSFAKAGAEKTICSYHNFVSASGDMEAIYNELAAAETGVIKIAVQIHDISEGLELWGLLKKARSENKQLVPIAMGEAGKWTRILGLAYGAPMTYASLETGKEVAPGQISVEDLRDVYRVKELNEKTDIFGVIGDPVKFSLSPYMQNAGFKAAGLNAVFIPLEVKDLESFVTRFLPESGLNIKGLSVTIPHKQAIMKYLDEIDETAQRIGAVNTVKIVNGKLYGYNTDAPGFIKPLKNAYGELSGKTAAVLGAGGGARAVIYALQKGGTKVTVFVRDPEKARPLADEFKIDIRDLQDADIKGFDIVINATPLGMKGKFEGQSPSINSQLIGVAAVYDLVYTPEVTPFIQEARTAGVPIIIGGAEMLVAQGVEQVKIWTGSVAPPEIVEIMKEAVRKKLG